MQACRKDTINLQPGKYLAYLKWDNAYCDWQCIDVDASHEKHVIQLTLDPSKMGQLEVQMPRGDGDVVDLVPLDDQGRALFPEGDPQNLWISDALGLNRRVESGVVRFASIRPGSYRVIVGKSEQQVTVHPGEVAHVQIDAESARQLRRLPSVPK